MINSYVRHPGGLDKCKSAWTLFSQLATAKRVFPMIERIGSESPTDAAVLEPRLLSGFWQSLGIVPSWLTLPLSQDDPMAHIHPISRLPLIKEVPRRKFHSS